MMGVLMLLSALLLLLLPPGLSRVVQNFREVPECDAFFLDNKTPNIKGVLLNGEVVKDKDQNRYKPICQYFERTTKKKVSQKYAFATLYDTKNKIPVFSAYTFTGVGGREDRPITWMIEPQLEKEDAVPLMQEEKPGETYTQQAVNEDYDKDGVDKGVNRGHLFPKAFAHQPIDQLSTLTLTNAVPQHKTFNEGAWSNMEKVVRNILLKQCVDSNGRQLAYLVTGAVPSENPEKKLNNRVNIPSVMWTAYCCYNSKTNKWISKAHWGNNESKGGTTEETLEKLNEYLTSLYKGDVQVFPQEKCQVTL